MMVQTKRLLIAVGIIGITCTSHHASGAPDPIEIELNKRVEHLVNSVLNKYEDLLSVNTIEKNKLRSPLLEKIKEELVKAYHKRDFIKSFAYANLGFACKRVFKVLSHYAENLTYTDISPDAIRQVRSDAIASGELVTPLLRHAIYLFEDERREKDIPFLMIGRVERFTERISSGML